MTIKRRKECTIKPSNGHRCNVKTSPGACSASREGFAIVLCCENCKTARAIHIFEIKKFSSPDKKTERQYRTSRRRRLLRTAKHIPTSSLRTSAHTDVAIFPISPVGVDVPDDPHNRTSLEPVGATIDHQTKPPLCKGRCRPNGSTEGLSIPYCVIIARTLCIRGNLVVSSTAPH